MRIFPLSYRTRFALYQLWRAVSAALVAVGVALPGGQSLWEQVVIVLLGLGGAGAATVAIAHTSPAIPPIPEPDDPSVTIAGAPPDLTVEARGVPGSALEALERKLREPER